MPQPLDALRQACDGLSFPSETDAPLEPFSWQLKASPAESFEPMTPDFLRELAGVPAGAPVLAIPLEQELGPLAAQEDWMDEEESEQAQRFRLLLEMLRETLQDVRAFRVGDAPQIDLYIVGRAEGGYVGLKTHLVET